MNLLIYLALAWMPFANSMLTVRTLGVTWTVYVALIILMFPFAFLRYLGAKHSSSSIMQDLLVSAFTLQLGLLLLAAQNPAVAGYKFVYGILMPVALYFVVKGTVKTEAQYLNTLKATLIGIILFSLIYVPTFLVNGLSSRIMVVERDSIAAAIYFTFALLFLALTPLFRKLRLIIFCLSAISLIATLSRGLMVCAMATPAVLGLTRRGLLNKIFVSTIIVSLFATMFLMWNREFLRPEHWDPQLENSIERLTNIDYWKNGIYGRLATFEPALADFTQSPLYGNGFSDNPFGGSTVHNFHLEWLQYGGILGYVLIMSAFLIHFSRASKFLFDPYVAASCIFILYIFVNGLMNGLMHGVAPDMLFLTMALNDSRMAILKRKLILRGGAQR